MVLPEGIIEGQNVNIIRKNMMSACIYLLLLITFLLLLLQSMSINYNKLGFLAQNVCLYSIAEERKI